MPSQVQPSPPSSMQAAFLHGIRDVRLAARSIPVPGPGEVLLKVASAGVCGSDIHYYTDGQIGSAAVKAPIILGHEFSARVARLGPDVNGLQVGQLVAVDPAIPCGTCEQCLLGHPNLCPDVRFCGTPPNIQGAFAEYALMPAANCIPLPANLTPDEGALLEPLGVALHAVNLAHLKVGDTVSVLGAGSIGLLIAKLSLIAGARAVFLTEPLAYRREFASRYLSGELIDPVSQSPVTEVLRRTAGRGVDVVFEAAGVADTPEQAIGMVRFGGKVVLAGIPADDRTSFTASVARRKGLTIKLVRRMKHTYPRTIRLVETGQVDLKPLVTHHLPLSRTGDAMQLLAAYSDGVIKVIIEPGSS